MSRKAFFHCAVISMAVLALSAPQAGAQRSISMRVGFRLTFIGDRVAVDARVVDNGRQVANAPLAYRIADPAVAAVSSRGEVVAKKPGSTKVWAVSGRDSAASLILVEPWPSKFAFSPLTLRLDAFGARQPLKVLISDAAGVPIEGSTSKTSFCRSVNERIATLSGGDVVAVGNGSTYIRCTEKGLADSVKVEVQQRPVSLSIQNKAGLRNKTYGDTFTVRISAKDRQSKEVVDPRATWASLNADRVSVDPVTGKARAINSGDAKILVQLGDVADSTTINVTGGPVFVPVAVVTAAVDSGANANKASVSAQDMFMTELDTATVSVIATDSTGAPIPNPRIRIRLSDNTIAKTLDSMRVVALKPGQTKLIVEYGSHSDTTKTVYVRVKSVASAAGASGAGSAGAAFRRPDTTWRRDSVPTHLEARKAVLKVIATDPRTAAGKKNLLFSANGGISVAEHLSHTSDDVKEDRTGPLYGGTGTATLFQKLELTGSVNRGTLTSATPIGEDLAFTEGEGTIGLFLVKELGIRLGYMLRTEVTEAATQHWTIPKASLVTRFGFIGDIVNTYAAFSLLPKASFSGMPELNQPGMLSRAGEAGLELRTARVNGGLTYYVEHFSFTNSTRVEDFSAIRFRLGFQTGW